jgi:hypothetical protein
MTVEEQDAQDAEILKAIEENLAEHRRLIAKAWSVGLDVEIATMTPPDSKDGHMWPTLVHASRHKEYINLHRKGYR